MAVENLLLLYAGILVINVVVAAVLWWLAAEGRNYYRQLFLVWMWSVLALLLQGLGGESLAGVALCFGFVFPQSLAIAGLLSMFSGGPSRWKVYSQIMVVGLLLGALAAWSRLDFWVMALPVALPVALPIGHRSLVLLRSKEATPVAKALGGSCLFYAAHILDFPILRADPTMGAFGFTIAILSGFAMSITAPAVVLERVAVEGASMRRLHQIKDQFFANISHELRTPLTVVLASLEMLLSAPGLSGWVVSELSVIKRNASRLLAVIDELLDLSRLDAGGLRLNVAPLPLKSIVQNVVETNRPLADAKSIELRVEVPDTFEGADIHGDAHRIETIMVNLVGNALKYTERGSVIVVLGETKDEVWVTVRDTGPGIPESELSRVFERFYQVGRSDRRRPEGFGLGLALSKELADLHGGGLTVESEVGEGTAFTLALKKGRAHFRPEVIERRKNFRPIAEGRRIEDQPATEHGAAAGPGEAVPLGIEPIVQALGPKILVVEDQPDLRNFIVSLFAGSCEVLSAEDGRKGLELVRAERPQVVVSDVMMPNMSGAELCRAIKQDPSLMRTSVIVLTARVGSEATLDAYAHGADDFVAKPFHPRVLVARVNAQLKLKALTAQLATQEKLAAIGTLAAGVAHEVRNPVNFIVNAAELLLDEASIAGESKELLRVISDGANRIESIVSALQTFAGPSDGAMRECDLEKGLESALRLLQHRMEGVTVHRDYQTARRASANQGEINQILLNLIDNSVRSGATSLTLRIHEANDMLQVLVEDDGPGIEQDLLERIFDPFFTTREPGEGTGLGLYISRRIAIENRGRLFATNRSEGGARMCLELAAEATVRQ